MSLPKINTPTYTLTIPSTKKQIKFRPFLVKEEKILLIAIQEQETTALFDAVKQVIKNCTFDAVDVDNLTTYDLEYLFLQIRIKSKGGTVTLSFQCEAMISGKDMQPAAPCSCINDIEFDLTKVQIEGEALTKKIILEESTQIGIILKAPTFKTTTEMQTVLESNSVDSIYKALPQYIDTIFEGEKVYDDFTPEELQDWIEELSEENFEKIQQFFYNIPRLKAKINVKCTACGYEEAVTLEGLQNFLE